LRQHRHQGLSGVIRAAALTVATFLVANDAARARLRMQL